RFKGNQVEVSIGRNEELFRIADQRSNRLHDFSIGGARQLLYITPVLIAQRFPQRCDCAVYFVRRTEVSPAHIALPPENVCYKPGFSIGIALFHPGVERTVGGELDQGSVRGNRTSYGGQRDWLRLRAEFSAALADRGF